ncbi:MAG: stage II sporulation protein M [Calditrichaeota bacterium]|nr:MAG: stage II sporulation protein M [Calditrichota bacterium]MBL1205377.1 stage II sporulation protein M [Calditrichota bacterium]NOG45206.1 stage II sporulation protein M [Calditrichota bacterium]
MQEVAFLKKNATYWKRVESLIETQSKFSPDELTNLYIRLTDDLAYSKTFYPQSKTTKYLNTLATRIHQKIYKNKKEKVGRFKVFWLKELPHLFYKQRFKFLSSLIIFSVSVLIGVVSAANDDGFVRTILGDSYVNMTLENIKNDDPMAVYKKMNEVEMFLGITLNNIRVSFLAFVSGLLASFGTGLLLLQNGIMLGSFQYFFFEHGLLTESILAVWVHGTLEISAIIIAGGAGLVMGNSILFPGTFSRKESFSQGAKEGMKIVIGLVPVFITAGFLEGFVTRHTDMPLVLNLFIIFASLGFVLFYFLFYPRHLNRKA